MPMRVISASEFDQQFTPDGFRRDAEGQPDKTDYSHFRQRIGDLIHALERLEAELRKKESLVVPGRENITPSTLAEMRQQYTALLNDFERARVGDNQTEMRRVLGKLRDMSDNLIPVSMVKLGLDKDISRGEAIGREVGDLVMLHNSLHLAVEAFRGYSEKFANDVVIGKMDPAIQAALVKERARYYKPRQK